MKVYTSYFYQIRNFTSNMLPISTAISDPKWFHENLNKSHVFRDKNGVMNGVRNELLHPGDQCHNLCHGKPCIFSPSDCLFLLTYECQLNKINFGEFLKNLEGVLARTKCDTAVFIVHEAPDNECSERIVIQKWFKKHGIECNEWHGQN